MMFYCAMSFRQYDRVTATSAAPCLSLLRSPPSRFQCQRTLPESGWLRWANRSRQSGEPSLKTRAIVFGIGIETRPACGGAVRIIACLEDPAVPVIGAWLTAETSG